MPRTSTCGRELRGASSANANAAAVDEVLRPHVQGVYRSCTTRTTCSSRGSAAMEGRSAVSRDAAQKTTDLASRW